MVTQRNAALTGDFAVVGDVVRGRAANMAARGFDYSGVTLEGSPKLGEFPMFHFINKRSGMRIDVSFSPAGAGMNGGFVVLITKPVNRKLDVEDFLKRHGRQKMTSGFTYRDAKTDVRAFTESFFDLLEQLFDGDLKPILDGTTFEETPIDWMGYK